MGKDIKREVMANQREMRLLGFQLDGAGTASLTKGSQDATLTDNGTGDYTLTFSKAFAQVPTVVATPLTADVILQIAAVAVSSVQIKAFDATDGTTAKDCDLHALAFGSDSDYEV